jgi:hypothetical protein
MRQRWITLGLILLTAGGCVTVPTGPSVMALPGTGKTFEQFQADDAVCRQWVLRQTGTTPDAAATQSTVGGAVIGTVVGAGLGAALGAVSGHAGTGAAIGAGGGLLVGTAAGASAGQASGLSAQRRYDNAYQQCMYANGNQVPVRGRAPVPPPPAGVPPPPPVTQ